MADSTKSVTTYSNVCIPVHNASIGDVLCHKNGATDLGIGNFIAVVGSTITTTTPPDGYSWYGVIYGFERGGIMVRALATESTKWVDRYDPLNYPNESSIFNSTYHKDVIAHTTSDVGFMRNGTHTSNTAIGMNVYAISNNLSISGGTITNLHPITAASSSNKYPMKRELFEQDMKGAKTLYGTYHNYLKQTFSVMKGKQGGVFGVRCGKSDTKSLADFNGANGEIFSAARFCFNYYAVANESNKGYWWLPDMYELATMMNDVSFNNCEHAHSVLGGAIEREMHLWSSVCRDKSSAWIYHFNGYSDYWSFTNDSLLVAVPVTLISLS